MMNYEYELLIAQLDSYLYELVDLSVRNGSFQRIKTIYEEALETGESIFALDDLTEEQIVDTDIKLGAIEDIYRKICSNR